MSFRHLVGAALGLALWIVPAGAAVTISFYAHHLGSKGMWVEFPHAYVTLTGAPDAGGPSVKANYGFTPPKIGPSILFGRVDGEVDSVDDAYIAKDIPYFSFALSDSQYAAVLATVTRWRDDAQPSYELDTHNCVIFVKEIAAAAGLRTGTDDPFVRDPAHFLTDLRERNAAFLTRTDTRLAGASLSANRR